MVYWLSQTACFGSFVIRTKRGLKIPISGEPSDTVDQGNSISSVAVVGLIYDFIGMKPTLFVKEGDTVQTVKNYSRIRKLRSRLYGPGLWEGRSDRSG